MFSKYKPPRPKPRSDKHPENTALEIEWWYNQTSMTLAITVIIASISSLIEWPTPSFSRPSRANGNPGSRHNSARHHDPCLGLSHLPRVLTRHHDPCLERHRDPFQRTLALSMLEPSITIRSKPPSHPLRRLFSHWPKRLSSPPLSTNLDRITELSTYLGWSRLD